MGLRVEPDNGPPVEFLSGGSRLTFEEQPEELIQAAVTRLRSLNRGAGAARPRSAAITKLDEALLWLRAFSRGEVR